MPITITADSHAAADDAWRSALTVVNEGQTVRFHAPGDTTGCLMRRDATGQLVLERVSRVPVA
jgi:hypothetical protein